MKFGLAGVGVNCNGFGKVARGARDFRNLGKTVAGALHFTVGRCFGLLGFGWLGFSDGVPAWPASLEIGWISRFPAWLSLSQFYRFCENRVCIRQNAVVFMTTSFAWNRVAHGAQIGRSQNIRTLRQHMATRNGFHEI